MSDTAVEGKSGHLDPTSITHPSWELFTELYNQIFDIDEVLDAGTESAGKRSITNALVENAKDEWTPALENAVNAFNKLLEEADADTFVGTYFGLIRGLSSEYKEKADAHVQGLFDAQPKPDEDSASESEKETLAAQRSELMKSIKPIWEMGKMFGFNTSDKDEKGVERGVAVDDQRFPWPYPKRRGAVGKRGRRATSDFDWTVNGETYSSVKEVADALGITRGEFTKALREAPNEIDTKEPPSEFTATVAGNSVSAKRRAVDETAEASEPSVSDEEDDELDEDDDEE